MSFKQQHKILVKAPPQQIWPWLLQLGTGRAGWYSHDWADNFGRQSFQYIDPELQSLEIGQSLNGLKVTQIEAHRLLRLSVGKTHYDLELIECNEGTEFVATLTSPLSKWLLFPTLGLAHDFMQKKQLKEIKQRAERPYSPAAERNKIFILKKFEKYLKDKPQKVLEIGSGTGQHALYFTHKLPHLIWTPSDVPENLEKIHTWTSHGPKGRLLKPVAFDLANETQNLRSPYSAVYSANVLHIVSKELGELLIQKSAHLLEQEGLLFLYGPFCYKGEFSSESNKDFDLWLKQRDPQSGIRDFEDVCDVAKASGLVLLADEKKPANNQFLVFKKN